MPSGLTKAEKKMITETRDAVVTLKTVIIGVPGTAERGLVQEVKDVKLAFNGLATKHNRLSQRFWLLVGILGGSGVLSGGIWGLLQL